MNQGSFVLGKIEQMADANVNSLVKEVTKLYVKAATGIIQIVMERDVSNKSTNELPAVFPQELVCLEHDEFCVNMWEYCKHLLACWTVTKIDYIEQEHQELVAAYHNKAPLQSALNACDDNTTFEEAWSIVRSCFKWLL